MTEHHASLATILSDLHRLSRGLSAEATYYWERHAPRYRYLAEELGRLARTQEFARILDVGMGFETLLLNRLFPRARLDCLGVYDDARFRPAGEYSFINYDLNDVTEGRAPDIAAAEGYDLIVFMEVLEHLYAPPELVLRQLAALLRPGGVIFLTTPNAAWLKNRLKLMCGKNPFEKLKADRRNMGHIREYTQAELAEAFAATGLERVVAGRKGLYAFNNPKDNFYSWLADRTHTSLSRTLVAVYRKGG